MGTATAGAGNATAGALGSGVIGPLCYTSEPRRGHREDSVRRAQMPAVFGEGGARGIEEARDVLVRVGEREIELGRHGIEEDAAPEKAEEIGASERTIRSVRAPIVHNFTVGEDHRGERTVALHVRG